MKAYIFPVTALAFIPTVLNSVSLSLIGIGTGVWKVKRREERKTGISILMLCPVFLQDQGLKANHLTASVMKGLQAEWLALIQKPRKRSVSYFYGRYAQLLFLVSFYLHLPTSHNARSYSYKWWFLAL